MSTTNLCQQGREMLIERPCSACLQVDLWTYSWASAIGITPMGIVCVYLGT